MKRLCCILLIGTAALTAMAQQDNTLFGDEFSSGGFGGPVFKLSLINGQPAVFAGGRGGWILNHQFVIGGGGYGLTTFISPAISLTGEPLYLDFGYGGMEVEYIFEPNDLFHASFLLMIGGGSLSYRDELYNRVGDEISVFTAEPAFNFLINVTTFFKMGGGIGYRLVSGEELPGFRNSQLSGAMGQVMFRFGNF